MGERLFKAGDRVLWMDDGGGRPIAVTVVRSNISPLESGVRVTCDEEGISRTYTAQRGDLRFRWAENPHDLDRVE